MANVNAVDGGRRMMPEGLSGSVGCYEGLALIFTGLELIVVAAIRFVRVHRLIADQDRTCIIPTATALSSDSRWCLRWQSEPTVSTSVDEGIKAQNDQGRKIMLINRRAFSATLLAGTATSLISMREMAAISAPTKVGNVVLVHGLFADGSSCWTEVIARLQAAAFNVTAVQNPLTTLPEAVASAERVLARQDGPTVLVGHSFSGMIVTQAGVHPNVSALVYVAARGQAVHAGDTR